jgi:WD40 repeat protein
MVAVWQIYAALFGMLKYSCIQTTQKVVLPVVTINAKTAIVLTNLFMLCCLFTNGRALFNNIIMKNLIPLLSVILFLSLFCYSCGNQQNKKSAEYNEMNYDRLCYLQENIDICGNLNSICFLDESHFVVSTKENPSVFVYDETGKQTLQIARRGNGPFEYINPAIVRCDSDRNIYVWCSMTLKMIVFDENGKPLNEFHFNRAIKDFVPYKNYIFLYSAGGFESVIDIYDRSAAKIITSIGKASEEHKLLSINDPAGGITLLNHSIIFTCADRFDIELCDINDTSKVFETKTYKTNDIESFRVEHLNTTTVDLMNSNQDEAMKYISRNSVINGLFVTNDCVVLKAKSGTVDIENGKVLNNSLFDIFYLFDKNLNYLYELQNVWKTDDFLVYDNLYASNGKDIYFIAIHNSDEEESQYSLNRCCLSDKVFAQ